MSSTSLARAALSSELTRVKAVVVRVFLWTRHPSLDFPLIKSREPHLMAHHKHETTSLMGPHCGKSLPTGPSYSPPGWLTVLIPARNTGGLLVGTSPLLAAFFLSLSQQPLILLLLCLWSVLVGQLEQLHD